MPARKAPRPRGQNARAEKPVTGYCTPYTSTEISEANRRVVKLGLVKIELHNLSSLLIEEFVPSIEDYVVNYVEDAVRDIIRDLEDLVAKRKSVVQVASALLGIATDFAIDQATKRMICSYRNFTADAITRRALPQGGGRRRRKVVYSRN